MMPITETVAVSGTPIELSRRGSGPPIVVLHGEDGTLYLEPFVEALAAHREVVVPQLPGWGGSGRPSHVNSVPDVADFCLELLGALGEDPPRPVPILGLSLGAWVAAELAIRCAHDVSALVLVAPVGIKVGDRESRDFVDVYATPRDDIIAAMYADPKRAPDFADHTDEDFLYLANAQEAVTRYAWEPYLHDRRLAPRLHRIQRPVLVVSGEHDGFVLQDHYVDTYVGLIGDNARHALIADAGHRIEEEAPEVLVAAVVDFLTQVEAAEQLAMTGGN